jgi:hypothetical protein
MQIFDYRDADSENKLEIFSSLKYIVQLKDLSEPKFTGIKYLPLSHCPF